jgi:hypothetical protein
MARRGEAVVARGLIWLRGKIDLISFHITLIILLDADLSFRHSIPEEYVYRLSHLQIHQVY